MTNALGPLPALDSQAASTGFVAVHPAGCSRSIHMKGGCRQEEVSADGERTASSVEREDRRDGKKEGKGRVQGKLGGKTGSDRGMGANRNMGENWRATGGRKVL